MPHVRAGDFALLVGSHGTRFGAQFLAIKAQDQPGRPIHLVAHSTGELVIREVVTSPFVRVFPFLFLLCSASDLLP